MSLSIETLNGPSVLGGLEPSDGQKHQESQTKTKSQVMVVGLFWFFSTTTNTKKRLLLSPPVPPPGLVLLLVWKALVTCISAEGKCNIAWSGRNVLSDITHPHLKHSSVAFSQGMEHLTMDEGNTLGSMAAVWTQPVLNR